MKEGRGKTRRKNSGYKRLIMLFIIAIIIILMSVKVIFPATVSLSKFVYSAIRTAYLNSKEFYFTSNILAKNENTRFEIKNWSGSRGTKTNIATIEMYSRKNTLKKSKVDIEYELKFDVEVFKYKNVTDTALSCVEQSPNEMTEEQLNEQIAFLKQYRIPVMSFQEMAKLRTDVKRKLLDNFDYYNSLSASEKDILGVMEWIELYRKQGIPDEEIILSHLDEIHSRCGHDSYDYTKNLVCSACSRDRGEYYKRISLADSMEHERQMQKQVSSLSEELDQIERQRINERSIENGKTG